MVLPGWHLARKWAWSREERRRYRSATIGYSRLRIALGDLIQSDEWTEIEIATVRAAIAQAASADDRLWTLDGRLAAAGDETATTRRTLLLDVVTDALASLPDITG